MHGYSTLVDFTTKHLPRAYVNSSIRFHHTFSLEERYRAAEKAGWNVFQFPSEMLRGGDLLSDSGTTTLTVEQMAAMILGDEAYGSNYGYFELLKAFQEVWNLDMSATEVYLFHQGRAAEHALFTQIGSMGSGLLIPSNGHFDTTRANIENNGIRALDFYSPHLHSEEYFPFKGNMDPEALEQLLQTDAKNVPLVYLTMTNNSGGGQPVSLENMKRVRALCDTYGKSLFFDVCRFAENAWFIKTREDAYRDSGIKEIVAEIFSLCDGFTISLKKDGLSNMGGALVIKRTAPIVTSSPSLLNNIRDHQILTEGHPTYGGLSGREIMTISVGLRTAVTEEYLASRISQVQLFGEYMSSLGIPVLKPFGGHAVYIDMDAFFADTDMRRSDYGGISLTALLLLKGIRLCELGVFAFGDDFSNNFVRCAIPRNKYELQDLYYVADCIKELYDRRHLLPRAVPTYGKDLSLRHFKARFELLPPGDTHPRDTSFVPAGRKRRR